MKNMREWLRVAYYVTGRITNKAKQSKKAQMVIGVRNVNMQVVRRRSNLNKCF